MTGLATGREFETDENDQQQGAHEKEPYSVVSEIHEPWPAGRAGGLPGGVLCGRGRALVLGCPGVGVPWETQPFSCQLFIFITMFTGVLYFSDGKCCHAK